MSCAEQRQRSNEADGQPDSQDRQSITGGFPGGFYKGWYRPFYEKFHIQGSVTGRNVYIRSRSSTGMFFKAFFYRRFVQTVINML